ncbi:MAG: CRTAC1 family protein, partial [Phycisphaerales bacterium]|nr:CRTAC1 family protein [Phycisphaerales bacterium]
DGTFTDIALSAGVKTSATIYPDGCGGAWGDYDLDGDLDLAVAGYYPFADGNRLYRNNGDETFTDVTTAAGLSPTGIYGYSPRFIDMNGDRYPELIIAADGPTTRYYINDGDGTFTNGTTGSNMVNGDSDMGMACADFDGDGDWDVYITTKGSNRLFMNQGNHVYVNQGVASGASFTGWGWAAIAVDFDHDTRPDLITHSQITGNPNAHPWAFHNVTPPGGPVAFNEVGPALGLPTGFFNDGRGMSRLDYDNDGDQDFLCFNYNQGVVLFRNDLTGPDINWIRIFLDSEGVPGLPTDGSGAVVKVTLGANTLLGRIDGGSNYVSQDENSAHFGLGAATTVDEIRVEWTNGLVTTASNVAANQTLILTPNGCIMAADVNRDYSVDFGDLNAILGRWGQSGDLPEDTDGDGSVNFGDLNRVLGAWGDQCP